MGSGGNDPNGGDPGRPVRGIVRRAIRGHVVAQFRHPSGVGGRLAGWVMDRRPSNRMRTDWTVDLLNVAPNDNVLEIGYGPGRGLSKAAALASGGLVVGIDHSESMRRMAERRNREALRTGRMRLLCGSLENLEQQLDSYWDSFFERIFGVNVLMFCDEPRAVLSTLTKKLAPGGSIAMTFQPRVGDTSEQSTLAAAEQIKRSLEFSGVSDVRMESFHRVTPMAICVIGKKSF